MTVWQILDFLVQLWVTLCGVIVGWFVAYVYLVPWIRAWRARRRAPLYRSRVELDAVLRDIDPDWGKRRQANWGEKRYPAELYDLDRR